MDETRARAHPRLPERPGGPGRAARRRRAAARRRDGPVGASASRAQAPDAARLRARHARVPLLAARLGARPRQAAVARRLPGPRRVDPGAGPAGRARRRQGPQRLLRPPGAALLPRRRREDGRDRPVRRKPRHRDARAGPRRPRRHPAGPLGRAALRGRGVPRGLRRPRRDLRGAGRARRSPRASSTRRRRPRAIESRLAPGRGARRAPCATATAPDAALPRRAARRGQRVPTTPIRRRCPTTRRPRVALGRAPLLLPRDDRRVLGRARRDLPRDRGAPIGPRRSPARGRDARARSPSRPPRRRPSGADFFGRVARRIVREARGRRATRLAATLARSALRAPAPREPPTCRRSSRPTRTAASSRRPTASRCPPALVRAIEARLGPAAGRRDRHARAAAAPIAPAAARAPRAPPPRPLPARAASTDRPTARPSRSRTRSPSRSATRDSCAPRASIPRATATPRTRAPSSGSSRGAARIADETEGRAATRAPGPRAASPTPSCAKPTACGGCAASGSRERRTT